MEPECFRLIGNHLDGKKCVHTVDGRNPAPVDVESNYVSHDLFARFFVVFNTGGAGILPSTVTVVDEHGNDSLHRVTWLYTAN